MVKKTGYKNSVIQMNPKDCKNCFYYKPREADPETNELAWGNWCLQAGMPVRIEDIGACKIAEVYAEKNSKKPQLELDI